MKIFFEIRKQKYLEALNNNGTRPPPPVNTPLAGPVPEPGHFLHLEVTVHFNQLFHRHQVPSRVDVKCKLFYASHCCCSWSSWTLAGSWHWSSAGFLKHPRTNPGGLGVDFQMADSEHLMKRIRDRRSLSS